MKEEADRGQRTQLGHSKDTGAAWCPVLGYRVLHLPPSSHPFSCIFIRTLYCLDNCSCVEVGSHRDTPKALPTFDFSSENLYPVHLGSCKKVRERSRLL